MGLGPSSERAALLSQPAVALLIESDGPGGAERVVATLAIALQTAGHRTLVVLPAAGQGWLADQLRGSEVTVEHFRLPRPLSFATVRHIADLLTSFRADVVHSHEFSMAVYGAAAGRRAGVPHVVTMHGSRYYAQRWRRRFALRWAARRSTLVAVSESLADHLRDDLGMARDRVLVVPNGIRFEAGRPDTLRHELKVDATAPLLVAVGNLYPVKGHRYLLEALARLTPRPSPVRVAIAGRGDELAPLQSQAAAAGILDRVHFLGLRHDVPDLLAAASIFVHPSTSEGLPMAVLEAMSAGRPVIATGVGDIPAALDAGEAGIIVPPGNALALARAIDALLDDPARAARLGTRARARVNERYSIAGMVAHYQRLYAGAITRRRGGV